MSAETGIISGADNYKRRTYGIKYGLGMEETLFKCSPEDRWLINLFRGLLLQAIKDYKKEFTIPEDCTPNYRSQIKSFEYVRRSAENWLFDEHEYHISVLDVCEVLGIDYETLLKRLKKGSTLDLKALEEAINQE